MTESKMKIVIGMAGLLLTTGNLDNVPEAGLKWLP